jgi:hypothetical protein
VGDSGLPASAGRLHVRESSDGELTAWLDRASARLDRGARSRVTEHRDGELLHVVAAGGDSLVVETADVAGPGQRYRAALSDDHQSLNGIWAGAGGGRLAVPGTFRRATGGASSSR